MQDQATDLECIQMMLEACEEDCAELTARVAQGKATIAELAEAQSQRRRLLALTAFIEERRFVPVRAAEARSRAGDLVPSAASH